ncbi:type III secretion system inner membrane ring lipoprotein SctJ [Herbaspirillum sp. CF444]|uniref:type III secretion system inner membrane ring lipoprotein SctJ n=1 Tax=Herbaspirillum sp. CF444 TaxID=1144319 RepID=UPI0002DEEF9A|nr:type III secretion inner membrane ring lipoprotein SctJ [Herbaspirillum sp. CF444]
MKKLFNWGAFLVASLLLAACTKMVVLQAGLTDVDANEIVLVLNRKGIEVDKQKTKEGVVLSVREPDLSRATEALNIAGLPRRNLSNLGEVFKKQGMISTPMEERIRYIHGLSEELESTLQQFDNVVAARVHVVLPERIAPGEPIQPSSAAVFIKYHPPLDEDTVTPRVRRLVASAIPGLSGDDGRNKVSVVMMPGEAPPPGIEWTTVGPFTVAATSASGLMFTLIVMTLLALSGAGYVGFRQALRNPRVARMVLQLAMRRAAKRSAAAGQAAAAPDASAAPLREAKS